MFILNQDFGVKEVNKILQNVVIIKPLNRVSGPKSLYFLCGSHMAFCEKCKISGLNISDLP